MSPKVRYLGLGNDTAGAQGVQPLLFATYPEHRTEDAMCFLDHTSYIGFFGASSPESVAFHVGNAYALVGIAFLFPSGCLTH